MVILVIPTIREESIKEFLSVWESDWDDIVVVEDNPTKTFNINIKNHFAWDDIEKDLGDKAWIISRRDSACRCYGYYIAWKLGADYIVTLDDDCWPSPGYYNICSAHIKRLQCTPCWTESVIGMRTRGLPYKNLGILKDVVANVGLWRGVPDLDAIQSLHNPITSFEPPKFNRIIGHGQYFPICGMNLCFERRAAVLSYFPLMEEYKRFDDIWFGVIFKKICDHLHWKISCGEPFVYHSRASDTMTNLVKEAPGIKANESFWEVIDSVTLTGNEPAQCMLEIGQALEKQSAYLSKLGKAIQTWVSLYIIS